MNEPPPLRVEGPLKKQSVKAGVKLSARGIGALYTLPSISPKSTYERSHFQHLEIFGSSELIHDPKYGACAWLTKLLQY